MQLFIALRQIHGNILELALNGYEITKEDLITTDELFPSAWSVRAVARSKNLLIAGLRVRGFRCWLANECLE